MWYTEELQVKVHKKESRRYETISQQTDSEKLELKSMDIASQMRDQLKELFPDVFRENKIDFDHLKRTLGEWVEPSKERFGLTWPGKAECMKITQQSSVATLNPNRSESVDFCNTQNVFIEGENLEVLKLLQKSYFGKIKFIYIDPPYNTGKEFIYTDKFQDVIENYLGVTQQIDAEGRKLTTNVESSGRFHSDWLDMMYPRLKISQNLLCDSGLIFVSIGQDELPNLMQLMHELFGEENFFALLIRSAMHTRRNSSKDFNLHADYVLVYGKNKSWFGETHQNYIREMQDKSRNYKRDDKDGRGPYKLDPLHARNYYAPYTYKFSNGVIWKPPEGRFPCYSKETLKKYDSENRIDFRNEEPYAKRYLAEVQEGVPPNTILDPERVGYNKDGTSELHEVLGRDKVFSQPKPVSLIQYFIELSNDPEAIVLDFFAGSGTTGHAVMKQNVKDGGNRRYILVQLPEPLNRSTTDQKVAVDWLNEIGKPLNLAEITKERLRKSAEKLKTENPTCNSDLGFKVFKLSSSNFKVWERDVEKIEKIENQLIDQIYHTKKTSTTEEILYEILLKCGFELTTEVTRVMLAEKEVFSIGQGTMLICLEKELNQDVIDAMVKANPQQVFCLDESFMDNDKLKVNAVHTFRQSNKEIVFKTI